MKILGKGSMLLLAGLVQVMPCRAEPAAPAPKELSALGMVTGLHTHFIKNTHFECRIIEVDGSATVALNPIYLYLVVTNNADLTRMVTLPQVSAVKGVRFNDEEQIIEVDVEWDWANEEGSVVQASPRSMLIKLPIENGKLPKVIDVVVQKPNK